MNHNKKIIALALAAIMIFTLIPAASFAGESVKSENEMCADTLYALGSFRGTEKGYELERIPNRLEASVMLVRLLGKETAALASNDPHPFTDVPGWAQGYISYMYKEGLTKGVSSTLFGSTNDCDSKMYVTLVLRALGYDDSKGDFSYNESIVFGRMNNLLTGADAIRYEADGFTRGDMAMISYHALFAKLNGKDTILLQKLYDENAVEKSAAKRMLDTIEAEDLIALGNYNTWKHDCFNYTSKFKTEFSVSGYPSVALSVDSQNKGQDLFTNPTVSYINTYNFHDGSQGKIEKYIVDGYVYTNDSFDGTKSKEKLVPSDIPDDESSSYAILEKYRDVKIDKSRDGSVKITLTYANDSKMAKESAYNSAGWWITYLNDLEESEYIIMPTKFEETYTINAGGELITYTKNIELVYMEDGDTDKYVIKESEINQYNNIGKSVTVTLPRDLNTYKSI